MSNILDWHELMPNFSDMKYNYIYDFINKSWAVYQDSEKIAAIDIYYDTVDDTSQLSKVFQQSTGSVVEDMNILQDFQIFIQRPEWMLLHINIPRNLSEFPMYYSKVLAGAIFVRARFHNIGCNPDEAWPQVKKTIDWLLTTDFFKAPASTRFHDCFEGGLCFHTLRVCQRIVDLMHTAVFSDTSKLGDAIFCALVHDWCKINMYEPYMRNVKNEQTGVWEKVQEYKYTNNPVLNLGHGVSSMFIASRFFRLSTEEATAIRWHMGSWRVSPEEINELQNSNENFSLVHLLQFADQLALVKY